MKPDAKTALGEPDAFAKLRKAAMNQSLKLAEVSQWMLDMADLLG